MFSFSANSLFWTQGYNPLYSLAAARFAAAQTVLNSAILNDYCCRNVAENPHCLGWFIFCTWRLLVNHCSWWRRERFSAVEVSIIEYVMRIYGANCNVFSFVRFSCHVYVLLWIKALRDRKAVGIFTNLFCRVKLWKFIYTLLGLQCLSFFSFELWIYTANIVVMQISVVFT